MMDKTGHVDYKEVRGLFGCGHTAAAAPAATVGA
jgi:hypothetical protein